MNIKDILLNKTSFSVVGHVDLEPRSSMPHAECFLSQQPGCMTQMDDGKYRRSSQADRSDTG